MGRFVLCGALILGLFIAHSTANAAIIWNSGTLTASSSVTNIPGAQTASDNPVPLVMSSASGTISTSASLPAVGTVTGTTSVTIGPSISITTNTNFPWQLNFVSSGASVGGTATFTESATELAEISIFGSLNRGSGNVTLKNAANTTIASVSPFTASPVAVGLTPGLYTINWNWGTVPFVGTGGASGMNFSLTPGIPEPATLSLILLPLLLSARRRRHCNAPALRSNHRHVRR